LRASQLREILKDFHRKNPLQPGLAKEELRSRELPGAPTLLLDIVLTQAKDIVSEGDIVRLASHRIALKQDEEAAVEKIEALFKEGALAVPATSEVLSKSGVEPARARSLLQILLKNRKLVRVGDDLIYHATAIESLRGMLTPRKGTRFSVAEFKEWTGVSRKYAIPLLEFLDRERVTRREGDSRIVN
jgi:selenocysteine-specific elongation factor